jgi:phosphopantothenoylcysteine decarboxylase/phosphopantothenate--cysteine ligase
VAGRADDLLTATVLVATCPVIVVPAMHTEMWRNAATQANVATLRERGVIVLEPAHGRLTGKDTGAGRLPEPDQIAELVRAVLDGANLTPDWQGRKVLITAGGTQENLDPVRFLGNRSSGRQGFALAEIAAHRGAEVRIVAGDTDQLPTPSGAVIEKVGSAREMAAAVEKHAAEADVIIMAAAVADFRPVSEAGAKMKKGSDDDSLTTVRLVENPDILASTVRCRREGAVPAATTIVGFAAETGDGTHSALDFAKAKLERKGCDLLMCNEVGEGRVFGQSRNRGWLLTADGKVSEVADGSKHAVAARILEAVDELRN